MCRWVLLPSITPHGPGWGAPMPPAPASPLGAGPRNPPSPLGLGEGAPQKKRRRRISMCRTTGRPSVRHSMPSFLRLLLQGRRRKRTRRERRKITQPPTNLDFNYLKPFSFCLYLSWKCISLLVCCSEQYEICITIRNLLCLEHRYVGLLSVIFNWSV